MTPLHTCRLWLFLLVALPLPLVGQSFSRAIDSMFAEIKAVPGCAVGVRHNGRVVHRAGYGLADLEHRVPITPGTVFYTGSLSKQFTATAVALAEREGLLSADDPIRRWLPEMPAIYDSITIRHLVHHTGGLREKWELLSLKGVPTATTVITQAMVLDLLSRQRGVLFPAGTRSGYSNSGYDLLATIVERASGESLRAFAEKRIFAPLSMRTARYGDNWGELITDRAMGYGNNDGEWQRLPAMVETVGSGSVYASVDDLLAWLASWESGLLGDAELQQKLETRGTLKHGELLDYAWGIGVDEWRGERRIQHSGALAGYRSAMWRLPGQRWAAVVLCNSADAKPGQVIERIAAMVVPSSQPVDRLSSMQTVNDGSLPFVIRLDELVGTYWSEELATVWHIEGEDGALVLRRGVVPNEVVTIQPDGRFRIGSWLFDPERDAGRQLTGFRLRSGTAAGVRFEKVGGVE